MITYNPLVALLAFLLLSLLVYLLFRPGKGWYWVIQKSGKSDEKVLIEDILKYLYHAENEDKSVDIRLLTSSLKESDAHIIETVTKMTSYGLINMSGDQIKLSQAGSDYALRMVRAHRLWEKFLAEKTGYKESDWHDLAEKKEHDLSDADTEKLSASLGHPQFDPHGDPIPNATGKIAVRDSRPLSDLEVDAIGRIVHIKDKPDVVYKQIVAENIHIGSQIRVVENTTDRVIFHAEGEAFKLAPVVAANISVSLLKKDHSYEENIARLSMLGEHEKAKIIGISRDLRGEARRRLLDLGFVKGADVQIDLMNPLGDPKAFLIKGTSIALRKYQASKVLIKKDQ